MIKKSLIKIIALAIVVGLLGFYGGIQYQKSQKGNFSGSAKGLTNGAIQQRGFNRQGNGSGFSPVSGQIVSIDDNTITIKTQDGSSKIIIYSTSTKVNKTTEGSRSDLKIGETIMTIGSESSGTITAQSISVGGKMLQGAPGGAKPGQDGQQLPMGE
jgi:hypothetical protein